MTDKISLNKLKIIHFTIQDAEMYCKLSNINPDNITELYLYKNELKEIITYD